MSMQLLEKIMKEADALPVQEQLQLAVHLVQKVQESYPTDSPRYKWMEICGLMPYSLIDEDAQAWVSRTRQESDEGREQQWRHEREVE